MQLLLTGLSIVDTTSKKRSIWIASKSIPRRCPDRSTGDHASIGAMAYMQLRIYPNIDPANRIADANIVEDASLIYCRRRRSQPMHKQPSARSRRPGNAAVVPFALLTSATINGKPSHSMHTRLICSIHLGPCRDQHLACGVLAILDSTMERGALVLRKEG